MHLSRGIFVSTLGLLKLPSSGTTTVHAQVNSVPLSFQQSRNVYFNAGFPRTQQRTRRSWLLPEMNTWKLRRRKRRQSGQRLRKRLADQGNNQTDTPILFQGEREKGKWQNFSKKAFGKKGFVKKSIFKSPEEADGKVGNRVIKPVKNPKTRFSLSTCCICFHSWYVHCSHLGGRGHDGHRREGDDRVQHCAQVSQGSMINLKLGEGGVQTNCGAFVSDQLQYMTRSVLNRIPNLVTISLISLKPQSDHRDQRMI